MTLTEIILWAVSTVAVIYFIGTSIKKLLQYWTSRPDRGLINSQIVRIEQAFKDLSTEVVVLQQSSAARLDTQKSILGALDTLKSILTALDSLNLSMDRLAKWQQTFVKGLYGEGPTPGYVDVDAEEENLREAAQNLQRRYKIPWEDALKRAKDMSVYEQASAGRMREQA